MKEIVDQYICRLDSDLIINQRHATEGQQRTLDFIPGSSFYGIVASKLYDMSLQDETYELFHSGKVRFGDAHPLDDMRNRSLRIPAMFFRPKASRDYSECYLHHKLDFTDQEIKEIVRSKQLKQARNDFYTFDNNLIKSVPVSKNTVVKSAYDSSKRRSKDEQLFTYESMSGGALYGFSISYESAEIRDKFSAKLEFALSGFKRIGRSRSAQYGSVEIKKGDFKICQSQTTSNEAITVYAESRLLFIDSNGDFTLQPTAQQLGFASGEIDWEKSQVRTFQYAPYNGQRRSCDADRVGIEKGSVFVIKAIEDGSAEPESEYVGVFNQEGFGKVIYSPLFLEGGEVDYISSFAEQVKQESPQDQACLSKKPESKIKNVGNSSLLAFINKRIEREGQSMDIYAEAKKYVDDEGGKFKNSPERFISQWGQIRQIARGYKSSDADNLTTQIENYIGHGVAKEKWTVGKKRDKLIEFLNKIKNTETRRLVTMEIASQMAKSLI